jgi:hypothetical protein
MRVYHSEKISPRLVLRHIYKQTHTESHSLLFESATFRNRRERGYERFLSGVSVSEMNGIQTIRITSHMGRVFARGDLLRKCYEYLDLPMPRGLCLLTLLVGFGGLNRAVLESEGR